jgi:hypothetical protein
VHDQFPPHHGGALAAHHGGSLAGLEIVEVHFDAPAALVEAHQGFDRPERRIEQSGKGFLKNGKPDGVATEWHANAIKSQETHYKDGKLDGLMTVWDEKGNKLRESQYKDGIEEK